MLKFKNILNCIIVIIGFSIFALYLLISYAYIELFPISLYDCSCGNNIKNNRKIAFDMVTVVDTVEVDYLGYNKRAFVIEAIVDADIQYVICIPDDEHIPDFESCLEANDVLSANQFGYIHAMNDSLLESVENGLANEYQLQNFCITYYSSVDDNIIYACVFILLIVPFILLLRMSLNDKN